MADPSLLAVPHATGPLRPDAEVDITEDLVRGLLRAQHPDLADRPLRHAGGGWDNEMWRLGDDLAVRMPRRHAAAHLVVHEARWLATIAALVPVGVPSPVRLGSPTADYPWSWNVVPWFEGTPVWAEPVATRSRWAADLARALAAMHVPAQDGAPYNPVRGTRLQHRDAVLRARLAGSGLPDAAALRSIWDDAVAAQPWAGPAVWVHGDPHPANLLASGGAGAGLDAELVALLDLGDLSAGDPATDLATAWLTFDTSGRRIFQDTYRAAVTEGVRALWYADDDALWRRARGWAVSMASAMLVHAAADPVISAIGRHGADQLALG